MSVKDFEPKRCKDPECGLAHEYLISLDPGSAIILKAMAVKIGMKKINIVHPRKEMETKQKISLDEMIRHGMITSNMTGNLPKLRMHGLIAKTGDSGNYCITRKGWTILHNKNLEIAKFAIRNIVTGKTTGYYQPDLYTTTLGQLEAKTDNIWEGVNYIITEGHVYREIPEKSINAPIKIIGAEKVEDDIIAPGIIEELVDEKIKSEILDQLFCSIRGKEVE